MSTTHAQRAAAAGPARPALPQARIDIVVPVHNEAGTLQDSIRRLHEFLSDELPYPWRIVIADNASTDSTLPIARALAFELDHTTVLHAVRKISAERQKNTELNQQLHVLEQTLKG